MGEQFLQMLYCHYSQAWDGEQFLPRERHKVSQTLYARILQRDKDAQGDVEINQWSGEKGLHVDTVLVKFLELFRQRFFHDS